MKYNNNFISTQMVELMRKLKPPANWATIKLSLSFSQSLTGDARFNSDCRFQIPDWNCGRGQDRGLITIPLAANVFIASVSYGGAVEKPRELRVIERKTGTFTLPVWR